MDVGQITISRTHYDHFQNTAVILISTCVIIFISTRCPGSREQGDHKYSDIFRFKRLHLPKTVYSLPLRVWHATTSCLRLINVRHIARMYNFFWQN